MVSGRMPASGDDGLDLQAINQADRKLNCVGCHTPIQRTGQSPASVGAEHLSFVWAPIFSDLLLHKMPVIDAERLSQRPRDPLIIHRAARDGDKDSDDRVFSTYDLLRNLADDSFSNLKASADGREFRTAPLMGLGRMGPPFLHDARVYLNELTMDKTPAGTVATNSLVTNARSSCVLWTMPSAPRSSCMICRLRTMMQPQRLSAAGARCRLRAQRAMSLMDHRPPT
jgi:hypothetical protein